MIEPLHHHCQRLDELPPLFCEARGLEERPRRWIDLEKPVVEQARRSIRNRQHFLPRHLHEYLFLGGHSIFQFSGGYGLGDGLMRSTLRSRLAWLLGKSFCAATTSDPTSSAAGM